jgi:hypothetical protein
MEGLTKNHKKLEIYTQHNHHKILQTVCRVMRPSKTAKFDALSTSRSIVAVDTWETKQLNEPDFIFGAQNLNCTVSNCISLTCVLVQSMVRSAHAQNRESAAHVRGNIQSNMSNSKLKGP